MFGEIFLVNSIIDELDIIKGDNYAKIQGQLFNVASTLLQSQQPGCLANPALKHTTSTAHLLISDPEVFMLNFNYP